MRRPIIAMALLVATCLSPAAAELLPNELVLIVNPRVPASRELAELYARERGVPLDHIIPLPMPDAEFIDSAVFHESTLPALRKALREQRLDQTTRCLVTFYGVPLTIGERAISPRDKPELDAINRQLAAMKPQLDAIFKQSMLAVAAAGGVELKDEPPGDAKDIVLRVRPMLAEIDQRTKAKPVQSDVVQKLQSLLSERPRTGGPLAPASQPNVQELQQLARNMSDAAARGKMRVATAGTNVLIYADVLVAQRETLSPSWTDASFESELALVWNESKYELKNWQANPLFHNATPQAGAFRPMMAARLDAPTVELVKKMITSSKAAESVGLAGKVVIDSRGLFAQPDSAYAGFDLSLKNLNDLLKAKTKLDVLFDDKEPVLPSNSATDVMLYCGWYSLRNYIRASSFVPGAVGYHVASFEMLSLHNPNQAGWVQGLLNDGIAATLGPVSEPYLAAFPRADEFFPLLLTGKLTLAEVYWSTQPMTSWKVGLVGDPLYRPFAKNPPLAPSDLPENLQSSFPSK